MTRRPIPALTVAAACPGEKVADVVARITIDLRILASRWRDFFRVHDNGSTAYDPCRREQRPVLSGQVKYCPELPTLVGLVVVHTVVAVVTYDAKNVDGEVRNLAVFDFGEEGQDVWNATAVGMVVVWVRDWLVDLNLPEVEIPEVVDEDV